MVERTGFENRQAFETYDLRRLREAAIDQGSEHSELLATLCAEHIANGRYFDAVCAASDAVAVDPQNSKTQILLKNVKWFLENKPLRG